MKNYELRMMKTNKDRVGWLAGLLTGWGVKESWAKAIAGAVVGALVAAGVLTLDSCTPGAVHQAGLVHELYHSVTGRPCAFKVEVVEKGK